jgi:hypothetical protein
LKFSRLDRDADDDFRTARSKPRID